MRAAGQEKLEPRGWANPWLLPLAAFYGAGWWIWDRWTAKQAPLYPPVFSVGVGNLVVGGTGKTPLVGYLARIFLDQGDRVAILSRGYRRRDRRMARLTHPPPPEEVPRYGDEPALYAHWLGGRASVWIHRDRRRLLSALLQEEQPDVILLDDNLQYRALRPHVQVVLLDRRTLAPPRWLLPAGPFREPFSRAARGDVLVINHKTDEVDLSLARRLASFARPVYHIAYRDLRLQPAEGGSAESLDAWRGRAVMAFSGIADPWSLMRTLQRAGLRVVRYRRFLDHHAYRPGELEALVRDAERRRVPLITTEKDWIRFQRAYPSLWVLRLRVVEYPSETGDTLSEALLRKRRTIA